MNASPLRLPDAGSIEAVDRAGGSPRPQLSRSGCGLIEREKREDKHRDGAADYPQVGPDGTHDTPLPDWFDYLPRELRFFQDWMDSSAAAHRVFANWRWIFMITPIRAEVGCIPVPCSHHKSGSCQCCPRTTLRTAS